MVINAPFIQWVFVYRQSKLSPKRALFYLETSDGQEEVVAAIVNNVSATPTFKASPRFLQLFRELLPAGGASEWYCEEDFLKWLEAIIYHSFLIFSLAGPDRGWFVNGISDQNLSTQPRLPLGLAFIFGGAGTNKWILLKHGSRIWPVEVVDNVMCRGWSEFQKDHKLKNNYKVVYGCERKWIFTILVFDENDIQVLYEWSMPNYNWKRWHEFPVGLRTSCLPSILEIQPTLVKFCCLYVTGSDLRQEFEGRLSFVLMDTHLKQIIIRMASRTWIIKIQNLQLNAAHFHEFILALDLCFLDYIMVIVSPAVELQVVIFDMEDAERIYDWF